MIYIIRMSNSGDLRHAKTDLEVSVVVIQKESLAGTSPANQTTVKSSFDMTMTTAARPASL